MSSINSTVHYADVKNFPGYRVGTDGSVWSYWYLTGQGRGIGNRSELRNIPRRLQPGHDKKKYLQVRLYADKKGYCRKVHRLVLEAFRGPRPEGTECRHLDGNPTNSHIDNLAWGTKLENAADCMNHGKRPRGADHACSKLSEDNVREIRRLRATGLLYRELAVRFHVSETLIRFIIIRQAWKHIKQ